MPICNLHTIQKLILACLGFALLAVAPCCWGQQAERRPRAVEVERSRVDPHWLDATHLWYQNSLAGGKREFVFVDAAAATRTVVEYGRLLQSLAAATQKTEGINDANVNFLSWEDRNVTLSAQGADWRLNLDSLELSNIGESKAPNAEKPAAPMARRRGRRTREAPPSVNSPDGSHAALIRDNNVFLKDNDGNTTQLSYDGLEGFAHRRTFWSPDSATLVAFRMEPGDHKSVYRLESSPRSSDGATGGGAGRAVLHTDEYALPGDKLDSFELNLFDVATGKQIKPDVERINASAGGGDAWPTIRWRPDGKHFLYEKHDRGHQRLRIIEVDATTGDARTVLDEQSKTFIWSAHTEELKLDLINYLKNGKEVVYVSEQSGWRQLYLLDLDTATLKPMTSGQWVLRGIDRIDEDARQIWFSASGVYPSQDPYLLHYGRVNFDGSELTWLTDADGNHTLEFDAQNTFSPDRKYFVVAHSRVDSPPVTELRSAVDGKLILTLETATVSDSWSPPEVFVAKGRDNTTDIWGIICRPAKIDPDKKYPIIEDIYAGPQSSYVPKTFNATPRYSDLTSMGFIVVKIDGMGTANRSKAFHDVCWHDLADAGFPDRIKWIKAAAAKYPYMDLDRVGIYGTSAGGQSAAGALLFHPEFYKVAVANCGCHDNRMDKASWNEQWMGFPIGPHYSASSNIDNAAKLRGRLQLVLGELDSNVPVESTYRFVDALTRARKDFEFVLVPGANHGADSPVTKRKLRAFFQRYLLGVEPPNPNES